MPKAAIFRLFCDDNTLHFNEMMMSVLY